MAHSKEPLSFSSVVLYYNDENEEVDNQTEEFLENQTASHTNQVSKQLIKFDEFNNFLGFLVSSTGD
jgi:hypothetical protein